MKNTFTISEIADFFNISTQTLRYYDKIGLMKPVKTDESSGYRLYSGEQFDKLYLIRDLKQLGLSLDQIKSYCETKDIRELGRILDETSSSLERQLNELQSLKKHVDDYLRSIRLLENAHGRSICEFRPIRERYAYTVDINFQAEHLLHYIDILQESYARSSLQNVEPGHILLGIHSKALGKNNLDGYNFIGNMLKQPVRDKNVRTFPEGLYAVACHLGSYDTIFDTYRKLLRYIRQHHYTISGDSLEISITDIAFTDNPEEFVTEIQIPVEEPEAQNVSGTESGIKPDPEPASPPKPEPEYS
ncbi:MerR family transcriptional regulator [uncultured Clostridium sp.]|uniref:MerR family transcriptional regulator n=1 Tax=uncultured Clostridium sp. TaxID=59620 RepID=UPI0025F496B5|nr:MerR family transcriptional regulator [uncultured Clostridium sp.]